MNWKIIIGLFWVNSATVHSRRLLPFLRDVLISLVKKARRAIDTWCMFSSSASLAFTAVIMHFRRLLLPLSRPWFWPRSSGKIAKYIDRRLFVCLFYPTAVIMHFRWLLLPLSRPWFWNYIVEFKLPSLHCHCGFRQILISYCKESNAMQKEYFFVQKMFLGNHLKVSGPE